MLCEPKMVIWPLVSRSSQLMLQVKLVIFLIESMSARADYQNPTCSFGKLDFFELTSSWELKFMTNAIEAGKHIAMLSDVTLHVCPQTSTGALGLPGSQVSYTSLVYSHS